MRGDWSQAPMPTPSQVDVLRADFYQLQARYNDLLAWQTSTMRRLVAVEAENRQLRKLVPA